MPIAENILAPDFSLVDENGNTQTLSNFRGKAVVLYFYPKDDTPGCTIEACSFRDGYGDYIKNDIIILGISTDSPMSHAKFKEKYHLPYTLLADEEHKVCVLYDVWGLKKNKGRQYNGILRTTFVINSNGMIIKVFTNVKPEGHSREVLDILQK